MAFSSQVPWLCPCARPLQSTEGDQAGRQHAVGAPGAHPGGAGAGGLGGDPPGRALVPVEGRAGAIFLTGRSIAHGHMVKATLPLDISRTCRARTGSL